MKKYYYVHIIFSNTPNLFTVIFDVYKNAATLIDAHFEK